MTTAPPAPNIIHPDEFARGYPHETWTWLRRNAPVYWWERTEGLPFWAVTTHADIVEISKNPTQFTNNPRWGVRDIDELTELAGHSGLSLDERVLMPANNMTLIWRRLG